MQLWGLNLDLVTCISLQLSVGLCIGNFLNFSQIFSVFLAFFFTDCAAHIGHQFLHIKEGDGNARALKTVENIGGAVWQGGGSTMLAVSLLAFSDAYTYQTFFKVFTIVIIFALFFGTFFLPVILSICSPKPYETEIQNEDTELTNLEKSEVSELIKANDKIKSDCDNNEIS